MIHCDTLLQNVKDIITKYHRSLLQNASGFLLQNATFITNCNSTAIVTVVVKIEVYFFFFLKLSFVSIFKNVLAIIGISKCFQNADAEDHVKCVLTLAWIMMMMMRVVCDEVFRLLYLFQPFLRHLVCIYKVRLLLESWVVGGILICDKLIVSFCSIDC